MDEGRNWGQPKDRHVSETFLRRRCLTLFDHLNSLLLWRCLQDLARVCMAHPTVSEVGRYDLRIFEAFAAFACDFCCDILAKGEFLPLGYGAIRRSMCLEVPL